MKKINDPQSKFALTKKGYLTLMLGCMCIIIGLFLMPAGNEDSMSELFDENHKFGTNLTLSVILIVLGFVVNLFAIFPLKMKK